jgi:hypothetical protein
MSREERRGGTRDGRDEGTHAYFFRNLVVRYYCLYKIYFGG